MSSLLQLRDEAFAASQVAHSRLRTELAVFKNEGYRVDKYISGLDVNVNESLMPQIATGCMRLIPAFMAQLAEISLASDKPVPTEVDQTHVESLENWDKMYEEVGGEGSQMRANVYRNLTTGNVINKTRWDNNNKMVRSEGINPCSFAPDPMCSQSNLMDAGYVCQQNWHNKRYMRAYYKDWSPGKDVSYSYSTGLQGKPQKQDARHLVDEIWLRRDVAEDVGIDISGTKRQIIVAKLIDDKLYKATGSPYWYPDFPYTHWRNFVDLQDRGKDHAFWGYGYGTLAWTQQKLLDEFISNFILIMRNLSVGRYKAMDGAIDEDKMPQAHGTIVRISKEEGFSIDDLQPLMPEEVPNIIPQFIEFISSIMKEIMPSLSEVFAGDQPRGNQSGRAIASLQFANFNQLSDNLLEMSEFRIRRKRQRLALTQQFARRPMKPHLWRGGLDMRVPFPEEARHIGYTLKQPDLTQLPNTPAGRMEMLNQMVQLGYRPINPLELLGLTKGYGWTMEDFMEIPVGPNGAPMNMTELTGQDPSMPVER